MPERHDVPVQLPQVNEVALPHAAGCRQQLVDGKIGGMQLVTELRIGNRSMEFMGKGNGPLEDCGSRHRHHDRALTESRMAATQIHSESSFLKCSPVGLHQVIEGLLPGREDVPVFRDPETMLLDHCAAGERTFRRPVAADDSNDLPLEFVKRHGRFLSRSP